MFKLKKIIGSSNTSQDSVYLDIRNTKLFISVGCAIGCYNGEIRHLSKNDYPDYIATQDPEKSSNGMINCMPVTEDMIFKTFYVRNGMDPMVGMRVGLTQLFSPMDATIYSASGKGKIVEVDADPHFVYVQFSKCN